MSNVTATENIKSAVYNPVTGAARNGVNNSGGSFSDILAESLNAAVKEKTAELTAGAMMPGYNNAMNSYQPDSGGGIEQAIMNAAASGEASDAQIALFMLCVMMQGNQDGEFSQLMGLMAGMLEKITGDTEGARNAVMSSDYDPYVLDTIDKNVFKTPAPEVTGTGKAALPVESWKPAVPAITNNPGERSPETLRRIIDQFEVETAVRYEPFRNGATYCNIFTWDVTSALGAELPHYVDAATGEPRQYPDIKGARELGAIATEDWLDKHGAKYGWREVSAETAQAYANAGKPSIASGGRIGHIQVVCPSENGKFDTVRGVTVAQAGSKVTNYTHISGIYSSARMNNIRYFVNE